MEVRLPGQDRAVTWTRCLVALGLGLRAYHYLRNPSMWHDEAALVLNVIAKNFHDLLGPLFYAEAAPPLFLWIERAVVLLLGDGVYVLRLIPFLASCVALLLLVPIARRVLQPQCVPWAILLFACSDHLLWHACEAKPYAVDVLAATILLAMFCFTQAWPYVWRIALAAAVAPCLIFVSYPGCFLYGGMLVALLPKAWHNRRTGGWFGLALLGIVVLASFGLVVAGPAHAQRCQAMEQCWKGAFPNWSQPWTVPTWIVLSSFELFRYCFEPIGQVFLVPAIVGGISLWRRGQQPHVLLLAVPILLAFIASCLQAYPFGGSRVLVYATPGLALLIAEGIPACLNAGARLGSRLASQPGWRSPALQKAAYYCTIAILLAPLGRAVQRAIVPWSRADCASAAAYVLAHRQPGEKIISNHWEYAYYFRKLGSDFSLRIGPPDFTDGRFWVVATAGTPAERQSLIDTARPDDAAIADQHEFPLSTVVLLSKQPSK